MIQRADNSSDQTGSSGGKEAGGNIQRGCYIFGVRPSYTKQGEGEKWKDHFGRSRSLY